MQPITSSQRQQILEDEIQRYIKRGYRLQARSQFTAQMVKPKHFSLFWALFWLILAVFPFFVYLLLYMAASDKTVYLEVTAEGRILRK